MEKYKNMLEKLKKETTTKLKSLRQVETESTADEIDQVQELEREDMRQKLLSRESFFLRQINQAILMVNNGTYGDCEECGCGISVNRLKARLTATRCIECQSEFEKN